MPPTDPPAYPTGTDPAVAQAHLAAIVESSDDAIVSKTLDGVILSWNAAATRLFGYTAAEAVGRSVEIIIPPERADEERDILARIRRGERVDHFETVRVARDGRRLDVSLTVSPLRDAAGAVTGASKIARDITEQKRTRQELLAMTTQLWQAAKLASVGELAASLAHELNNPLGTVHLRLESVLARTPADDPRRRALEVIDGEVTRMADLVSSLLQFSRRGDQKVSTVDVRDELGKAVDLIHYHLRKRLVRVVSEFAPDTPVIFADRQKLRQVFLNLLSNAGDAMPDGGTLTLRVAPADLGGKPAVAMEFADTGVGVPAEHLASITDPFFTTKAEGQGTGLGLAICKRVVDEHHGEMDIASAVGKGTTVRVVLPVTNGANVNHLRAAR